MESEDPEVIQLELEILRTLRGSVVAVARCAGHILRTLRSGNSGLARGTQVAEQAARSREPQNRRQGADGRSNRILREQGAQHDRLFPACLTRRRYLRILTGRCGDKILTSWAAIPTYGCIGSALWVC